MAIVRTSPKTVLDDYARLMELAGYREVLPKRQDDAAQDQHLVADVVSGVFDGALAALKCLRVLQRDGYDLVGVHTITVVVDTSERRANNKHRYVTDKYGVPCVYIYLPEERWVPYQPKQPFLVLDKVYPEGVVIPEVLIGKNIIQLPTEKTHVFTTITGRDEECVRRAPGTQAPLDPQRNPRNAGEDLLMIQRIFTRAFAVMDGTFAGDGPGPRAMHWHENEHPDGVSRSGGDRRSVSDAARLQPTHDSVPRALRTSWDRA